MKRMSKGDGSYGMLHSHSLKTVVCFFVFVLLHAFVFTSACVCEFVCNIPVKFF